MAIKVLTPEMAFKSWSINIKGNHIAVTFRYYTKTYGVVDRTKVYEKTASNLKVAMRYR